MKQKIIILLFALAAIFTSCKDDEYNWEDLPNRGHFSFDEKVTIIEVDENVTSFRIKGSMSEDTDIKYLEKPANRVEIDKEKTTARHKVHFINVSWGEFYRSEGRNLYKEVTIIPENITTEVEIYYNTSIAYPEPDENQITETVIRLIPKKKK